MKPTRFLLAITALAAPALAGSPTAPVAPTPGPAASDHAKALLERDVLLGDLGGARSGLEQHGLTVSLLYTQEYLGVVAGGLARKGEPAGLFQLTLDLDLGKALGWSGSLLHASAYSGWGESISGRWIGDESNVSNINMRNGTRLFEAYLQQAFGERLSIRAGLLATDSEYYSSTFPPTHAQGGSVFVNSDFGALPIMSFNVPEPIFPVAGPGVSLTFTATDALTFRAAIYDGQPPPGDDLDDRNPSGFQPRLSLSDGALLVAELEYDVNQPHPAPDAPGAAPEGQQTAPSTALGGCYRIGGFYHTEEFTEWRTGRSVHGFGGGWITANQMLWRENGRDDQGLSAFARIAAAPRDRSILQLSADAGFGYHGLLPGRDDDDLGLGVASNVYSRDYSRAQRRAGNPGRDHETIVELTYRAALTPAVALQPDVQWVIHPAGDHAAKDALVAGLRVAVGF